MVVSLSVVDINDINNYFKKFLFCVAEAFVYSAEDLRFNQPMAETVYSNTCVNISAIRSKKGNPDEIFF